MGIETTERGTVGGIKKSKICRCVRRGTQVAEPGEGSKEGREWFYRRDDSSSVKLHDPTTN